jgi:3-methyladenine DNA glycosylase AlkD
MVTTSVVNLFYFTRKGKFPTSLSLAELLLPHEHYPIHKVIGWLLREIGKRGMDCMEMFLYQHISTNA